MSRTLDLSRGREHLRQLRNAGYNLAVESVLQGVSRVVDVDDTEDWDCFKDQVGERHTDASYQGDIDSLLMQSEVASFCVSYRHVHPSLRKRRGDTMNNAQWERLHNAVVKFARTYGSSKVVLWIDQILHCRGSMSTQSNWVTKGVLPYAVIPVLYVGGPNESEDDIHQQRLWVAIERYAALTNAGIVVHGRFGSWKVLRGASLSLAQSLKWLAGRIIGGVFNSCGLSWEKDYLIFRDLSIAIWKSFDGISALEHFLAVADETVSKKLTTMDAFNYSSDSQPTAFDGGQHVFHGTYLGSKLVQSCSDLNLWDGLREWVQYKWIDGTLDDPSSAEHTQIVELTQWYFFEDGGNRSRKFVLGIVSAQGEVGAMGVAHVEDASLDEGCVLWFQRGLSDLARAYARQLFFGREPEPWVVREISHHWKIQAGKPLWKLGGRDVHWTWEPERSV